MFLQKIFGHAASNVVIAGESLNLEIQEGNCSQGRRRGRWSSSSEAASEFNSATRTLAAPNHPHAPAYTIMFPP